MYFPIEVWEIILSYTDPVSLTVFRSVCKDWYYFIDKFFKISNIWYHQCIKDIPETELRNLMMKYEPALKPLDFKSFEQSDIWISVYRAWKKTARLHKFKPFVEKINGVESPFKSPYEKVTCTASTRNILAVGSSEGLIRFYNLNDTSKLPFYVADQATEIREIKFLYNDVGFMALVRSAYDQVYFWDVGGQRCLDHCNGTLVNTFFESFCIILKDIMTVEIAPSYEVTECTGDSNFVASFIDWDKVTVCTERGTRITKFTNEQNAMLPDINVCIPPPPYYIRKYYLFSHQIFACITEHGNLCFSINNGGWTVHNAQQIFQSEVTSVLFFDSVLLLGMQSGCLRIFNVENISDLEQLDFTKTKGSEIFVSTEQIISLELMLYLNKYHVIAATPFNVYRLKY